MTQELRKSLYDVTHIPHIQIVLLVRDVIISNKVELWNILQLPFDVEENEGPPPLLLTWHHVMPSNLVCAVFILPSTFNKVELIRCVSNMHLYSCMHTVIHTPKQ